MKTKVRLSINENVDKSLNVCIEDDNSGDRILGGKGNGAYNTIESFPLNVEKIDDIIKTLQNYKKILIVEQKENKEESSYDTDRNDPHPFGYYS